MKSSTHRCLSRKSLPELVCGNALNALILLPAVFLAALTGCDVQSTDPELSKAARAMHHMTTRPFLSRSCFYVAYPNGSPTDYVDYIFSPLGAVEWPPGDGSTPAGEDVSPEQAMMQETMAFEAEQARAAGLPVLPGSVRISRLQRSNSRAKELVLSPADEEDKVMAKGYLPGETEPVLQTEWTVAKASPGQAVRQMCESNIEMGVRVRPRRPGPLPA